MKPDTPSGARLDRVERAHLRDPSDRSHAIYRYDPPADLAGLVQRYWIPVWSLPSGQEAPQRVLQYPVALMVITSEYARFYGVVRGLSTTTLTGVGWAVGIMFQPAAGALITGATMAEWTDRFADLTEVIGESGTGLAHTVRQTMTAGPDAEASHRSAMDAYADVLRCYLPGDAEGILVNSVVAFVEARPDVIRVAQICVKFGLSERALQRLTRRRLGLTPKWLIQRRRLQEGAELLRRGDGNLADVAARLGYADQPHFTHDFHTVTGMTPGEFVTHFALPDRSTGRSGRAHA